MWNRHQTSKCQIENFRMREYHTSRFEPTLEAQIPVNTNISHYLLEKVTHVPQSSQETGSFTALLAIHPSHHPSAPVIELRVSIDTFTLGQRRLTLSNSSSNFQIPKHHLNSHSPLLRASSLNTFAKNGLPTVIAALMHGFISLSPVTNR